VIRRLVGKSPEGSRQPGERLEFWTASWGVRPAGRQLHRAAEATKDGFRTSVVVCQRATASRKVSLSPLAKAS
jgi:hypothetical protein